MILASIVLSSMIIWMAKNHNIAEELKSKAEESLSGFRYGIFTLAFILVFREGIETILFLMKVLIGPETIMGHAIFFKTVCFLSLRK